MSAAGRNMNCEDYKQAIAADPSESFDGGALHSAECPSCNTVKAEMQALDVRIAAALAIDVPDLKMPELPTRNPGSGARANRSTRTIGPHFVWYPGTLNGNLTSLNASIRETTWG